MATRMVWDQGQGSGQLRFGRWEGRDRIRHERVCTFDRVRERRTNERVDIVGISGQRPIEEAARLREMVRDHTFIEPSHPLKIEVHRVGIRGLFGAPRLGSEELAVQGARQARDDFVLHIEEIGQGLVEPFRPEMIPRSGVDELDVDAHATSHSLDAALEHIADVQFPANHLHVERLASVSERRIAGDHDCAAYPREICSELFS